MFSSFKKFFKNIIVGILSWESRLILAKYKPRIIAITGSVGKTSTKDAIYAVCATSFFARKSEKSFNGQIGIPLTILGCRNGWDNPITWFENIWKGLSLILFKQSYPAWLILEVGADRPGDIRKVSGWLKPHIVVVTRFAPVPVHVEFFKSPKHIIEEKSHLVKALRHDGILVINADDPEVAALAKLTKAKVMSFGFGADAHIKGSHVQILYSTDMSGAPVGTSLKVNHGGNSVPVTLHGSVGSHLAYSFLAACAVGVTEDINLVRMSEALSSCEPPPGRMKLIEGIKQTTIIDDTYNASPIAVGEALRTLKELTIVGRKIAVMGDMMELGKYSADEHATVGRLAAESATSLVTVGLRSRGTAEGALSAGMDENNVLQFDEAKEAGAYLQNIITAGDCILVKGSQSMRMERVVEEIMAHPEQKAELLVRQDDEWKAR